METTPRRFVTRDLSFPCDNFDQLVGRTGDNFRSLVYLPPGSSDAEDALYVSKGQVVYLSLPAIAGGRWLDILRASSARRIFSKDFGPGDELPNGRIAAEPTTVVAIDTASLSPNALYRYAFDPPALPKFEFVLKVVGIYDLIE